jgi:hypothetical protein
MRKETAILNRIHVAVNDNQDPNLLSNVQFIKQIGVCVNNPLALVLAPRARLASLAMWVQDDEHHQLTIQHLVCLIYTYRSVLADSLLIILFVRFVLHV